LKIAVTLVGNSGSAFAGPVKAAATDTGAETTFPKLNFLFPQAAIGTDSDFKSAAGS